MMMDVNEDTREYYRSKTLVELKKLLLATCGKWKGISKWKKEDYVNALVLVHQTEQSHLSKWKAQMALVCAEHRRHATFPRWNYEMSNVLDELTNGNRTQVPEFLFNVVDGKCIFAK